MLKKTAIGATAAAATLALVGIATPAMAADGDHTSISKWYSTSTADYRTTNTVIAPEVSVLNGDILNGNSVGSGNNTALGNNNETAVGNVTGNDVSTSVTDVVDNVTHTSISDIVDVNDILGDVSGWVDLSSIFED